MLDKRQLVPNKFIMDIMPKREIKEIAPEDKPRVNTIERKKKEVRKPTVIVYK